MASEWTNFQSRPTLLDVTVGQISPNADVQSPDSTGVAVSGSDIALTPGSISTTRLSNGYVAEALIVEITSPVDNSAAANQFPDADITFVVDGKDIKDYIVLDGSFGGNMFPRKKVTHGSRQILLGLPSRELLQQQQKHGNVANMPLLMTGIKYASSLDVRVKSVSGWGNNGGVVVPLRVRVYGVTYKNDDLLGLASGFSPDIAVFQQGSPEFYAQYMFPSELSIDTWTKLPGGFSQVGNSKVYRRIQYAYNALATGTSGKLVLSKLGSVSGGPNNVTDTQHDLGDDFTRNNDMFLYQQFGWRIPSGSAYVGFQIGRMVTPMDTDQGTPISYNTNDYQYGEAQPQSSTSGSYFALPEAKEISQLMVYGNAVAPFISTAGLQSFAANTVSAAKAGVLVTGK